MGKSKKPLKYKPVTKNIDTQRSLMQAIALLDNAALRALESNDAQAIATAGTGWAEVAKTVWKMEAQMRDQAGVDESRGRIEFSNPVGFGPTRDIEEDEDDED
jgi:hypothetical protein